MNQASSRVSLIYRPLRHWAHPIAATIAAFGDRTIHTYHTEGAGRIPTLRSSQWLTLV